MKKLIKIALAMLIIIVAYTKASPVNANINAPITNSDKANYLWYKDEEMTEETGTESAVYIEINRLSLLFPGYTFSSNHTMGLYPYEYGYHSALPTDIIYSNR